MGVQQIMRETTASPSSASFAEPPRTEEAPGPLVNLLVALEEWLIHSLISELQDSESQLRVLLADALEAKPEAGLDALVEKVLSRIDFSDIDVDSQIEDYVENSIDWEEKVKDSIEYNDLPGKVAREIDVDDLDLDDKVEGIVREFLHNV